MSSGKNAAMSMRKTSVAFLLVLTLGGSAQAAVTETQPQVQVAPPVIQQGIDDISAWTYGSEAAMRFGRPVLNEPEPRGAIAVSFQVQQVEDLDRCVFHVYLDNGLRIDDPERPVGFFPFVYPFSLFFLKFSSEDQQAIEAMYLSKYKERRAYLKLGSGEEKPLNIFHSRFSLYTDVMWVSLLTNCDEVPRPMDQVSLYIRTKDKTFHVVDLSSVFLERVQMTLRIWRRPQAKLDPVGLPDPNVWTYTPKFGKRFGLPELDELAPTGAEAVAFRVEKYHKAEEACLIDVYLNDTIMLLLPEAEIGFRGQFPLFHSHLSSKSKTDWNHRRAIVSSYSKPFDNELFAIQEVADERERKALSARASQMRDPKAFRHIVGNTYRVSLRSPIADVGHRKHAMPGLTYMTFSIGCMTPYPHKDKQIGIAITKSDGSQHEILLPAQFLDRLYENWKVRHDIPFKERIRPKKPREKEVS
jgi:hypothetical protein